MLEGVFGISDSQREQYGAEIAKADEYLNRYAASVPQMAGGLARQVDEWHSMDKRDQIEMGKDARDGLFWAERWVPVDMPLCIFKATDGYKNLKQALRGSGVALMHVLSIESRDSKQIALHFCLTDISAARRAGKEAAIA